ncbi:type I restriction endonuclease subunit R [Desulfovibrio litoralis]|uniref:Type I restriction enzyme, R subunit n=1 Tax=Desulfovibrio litoralis DSM 11393 TaxID=1121455 RepID=A0A1M7SZN2_9BACT|nr:type I restriction endonuclease subunit R [Desulfovibrio litoralis]SHN63857.1 type I restriction enzyme, R subunit [Desulfovibrio litoralis DSM 11393]
MQVTNTKESGLETLIVNWLVAHNGYEQGKSEEYNKDYAVDETRLFRFLETTQPKQMEQLGIDTNPQKRMQFLNRLQGEIAKRGVVDVLRSGVKVYPADLIMFYQTPSEKNVTAKENFEKNIFSVTRQLMYSKDNTKLALDFCVFINGLPVITCELKNQLTKQDVEDAEYQYKKDRDSKELLFQFKRCMVHFAVDDARIKFCTKLDGMNSWFLPFDKGYNDGAGNPPNPNGIMTDYFWKEILTKNELANIIENYAQVIEKIDPDTTKKTYIQIFPRFHQLAVVKALITDVKSKGVGQKYLIQHSAGSGKSNSIAWLAHQLVDLEKNGSNIIDSVIVVTDRVNLDKQIRDTIKQFMQSSHIVAWAEHSGDLKKAISGGKKIIITTVHKFPFILEDIGTAHKGNKFAIIIDEAHSSQSGNMSAKMNMALAGEFVQDDEESTEDKIIKLMEGRKMLTNASYFAFTATPKNKTLEMFGEPDPQPDGVIKHKPFHNYSMKQAIQEKFIMDVLKFYTPIKSYYKLAKVVSDDPMFDKKKAHKKLRNYVESNEYAISQKAEIMVDHFYDQLVAKAKIKGKARAMVVTSSIIRAIEYYYAISKCLEARKSPYKAIIAFSGEKEYHGQILTEEKINGFSSKQIEKEFKKEPYRFLIVADKFQTGYDEPLLHTMYVDKVLTDIKAVQTLSRLNRAHPQKFDTFVLDFTNDAKDIQDAFSTYYRTTILSAETDPNKLYDLISTMEKHQVYTHAQIDAFIDMYLNGEERDKLDPILDACASLYKDLDEDGQIDFKSSAKGFVRTYGFLGAILPYGNAEWEKLSIFINLLLPKLPSPKEDDLSSGIIEAIDLDSYRSEAQAQMSIQLEDEDAEVAPVPTVGIGGKQQAELDLLTNILTTFNDLFGNIIWTDEDNVRRQIAEIPAMVSRDSRYQNAMKNSDKQNARIESERALKDVVFGIMSDNMELLKQFNDNPSFKKWLSDMVFSVTYNTDGTPLKEPIQSI